nr:RNA-directed DNA polymerase, eukaryota, reverse transcriptase zinc-binding domain protein [Tanacetum cinerariifolium]
MVVPVMDEEGHAMLKTKVEYEWKPPQCSECLNTKAGNDKTKKDSSKLVNPNPFDVLNAMERENDMGESSGRKEEPITLKDNENDTDYESNDPRERRVLWADRSLHKRVVRGLPWVLLGDFNVALNMEDICTVRDYTSFGTKNREEGMAC